LKNGQPIQDANDNRRRVANPGSADNNAVYAVKVFNEKGSVKSREAKLTILPFSGPVIRKTSEAPEIDGKMDGVWKSVKPEELNKVALGKRESTSDISATFRTLWDDQNIYLLIQINDDVKSDKGSAPYEKDGIELYFDCDNSKSPFYGDDEFHLRYNWHEKEMQIVRNELKKKIICAQSDTETGYNAEIAIPWEAISCMPDAGHYLGFDIHINDNDGNGRKCKITWNARRDNAHQTPVVFGTLKLSSINE
jgi:endo-1,4-beta-xylanase